MESFLEILKYTVPAFIVFLTVYVLQKQYLKNRYELELLDYRRSQKDTTLPLKLQAYERLTLFCERINVSNLILRIRSETMSASDLHIGMLVSIQKEFEHNVAQQVYVSPELWEIVKLVKNETINLVTSVAQEQKEEASALDLSRSIFNRIQETKFQPVEKALLAIKKEAGLLM